jgi:hypothetical protein
VPNLNGALPDIVQVSKLRLGTGLAYFFCCVNYSRMYSVWNMYLRTYSIHLRATAPGWSVDMYVVVKGKGECVNTWRDSGQILLAAEIGSLHMYSVWNMYLRTYSIHLRATAPGSVHNVADD